MAIGALLQGPWRGLTLVGEDFAIVTGVMRPGRSGLRGLVRFHSGEISPRQFVRGRIGRAGFPNRCMRRFIRRLGSLLEASAPTPCSFDIATWRSHSPIL